MLQQRRMFDSGECFASAAMVCLLNARIVLVQ